MTDAVMRAVRVPAVIGPLGILRQHRVNVFGQKSPFILANCAARQSQQPFHGIRPLIRCGQALLKGLLAGKRIVQLQLKVSHLLGRHAAAELWVIMILSGVSLLQGFVLMGRHGESLPGHARAVELFVEVRYYG